MPYVDQEAREELKSHLPRTAGELNYIITRYVLEYVQSRGVNYAVLNETIGVLECAKLELYRRLVSPYEDRKIAENGDVY